MPRTFPAPPAVPVVDVLAAPDRPDRGSVARWGQVLVLPVEPVDDDAYADSRAAGGASAPVSRLAAGRAWAALAAELGVDVDRRLERRSVRGRAGETLAADLDVDDVEQLLLVGVGHRTPADLRGAGAAAMRACRGRETVVVVAPVRVQIDGLRALVEGLVLGTPAPTLKAGARPRPPRVRLLVRPAQLAAAVDVVSRGLASGRASLVARDLAATPSNIKDPAWLAARARRLGEGAGLAVHVRDEDDLALEGFGGLLAVGRGSARPPRLVTLSYEPAHLGAAARRRTAHVVLVGKGITFDSGGLSLKPREGMVPMKTDMAGAAAVLATLVALPGLRLPLRVTGVLACAENLPGADAYRPSDVITHWGGRTTEVRNTDAEGRLVLADALAWAAATLRPDVLVDVATLTGAATVALGRTHAALLSDDDRLAAALGRAGVSSGERVWRLPLHEEYASALASTVADSSHVPGAKAPGGGAITAALFLRPFVGDVPWAHLDIAGPGRTERERDDSPKGATGFGARLLLRWLESMA